jgi:hypothetical protein
VYYKHIPCATTVTDHKRASAEELDDYFVNTLLPMAHSVQIVPALEYCVSWTIEYATQHSVLSCNRHQRVTVSTEASSSC